jgi:hypothetical protein
MIKKKEGSKKDKAEDKKLMKKYGYKSMKAWEKSKEDKKHDLGSRMKSRGKHPSSM